MDKIKFRNYTPQTDLLDGLFEISKAEPEVIEPFIEDKLNLLGQKGKITLEDLDFKKIDWDLKRRIEGKMQDLDEKTRKSIDLYLKNKKSKGK